ncbi:TPA: pyridoxal phosphate-dependent aminotransferase [Candidatus Woesearchaeota archaeon]|nr:pyridoxal phosphate-dependent aminotransferase [Candidatus Woesearchaeota archaeon]HIH48942.1 pyridoxal phosphate-dependent aminotransferase [Candidatus Woesearchaeota archaeon]HIJ02699.1 pyridoxal phosphate-dependent aminotransferase [Candidatus Woesearchaeota archaeon]
MTRIRLDEVSFSGIGNMVKLANSIGGDLIRGEVGDVGALPPEEVRQALINAYDAHLTHYPPFQGDDGLLDALVIKVREKNHLPATKKNIFITSGCSIGLSISLSSILNDGDEVITTDPIWCHIPEMIKLAGGIPVFIPLHPETGRINLEALARAITPKTKAIIINTPNNPTGAVLSLQEANKIISLAKEYGLFIISDEEYESFVYEKNKHFSIGSLYEDTITCFSFSKTYALSGFRLGYLVFPEHLMENISKMFLYTQMYPSSLLQKGALAALTASDLYSEALLRDYTSRAKVIVEGFTNAGLLTKMPEVSVYVWPKIPKGYSSSQVFCEDLLRHAGIVAVPGSVFGNQGKGHIRYSLFEPVDRQKIAVKKLQGWSIGLCRK